MKGLFFPILISLLLAACGTTPTSDVEATIQVGIAATLTAQPTDTPVPTPKATPTPTEIPTQTPTPKPFPPFHRPSPGKETSPSTYSLETYEGQWFSFQYPPNARVENVAPFPPETSEIHVIGPIVWVKPGDADWGWNGPAYKLIILTYENPDGLDSESWARDYILNTWKEARERNEPWGSLPVSEEGVIEEDSVGSSVVAGQPAFWVNYFAFDSSYPTFYLTGNGQVVALSFNDYPLENQPLATMQQDVYALIIDTFRFNK